MSGFCHYNIRSIALVLLLVLLATTPSHAFAPSMRSGGRTATIAAAANDPNAEGATDDRRGFLSSCLLSATTVVATLGSSPLPSLAAQPKKRYVLDDETGDYVEVLDDGDWQTEWKSRYDTMSTMSREEILVAARGAGNLDSKDLANESPVSKKRRAFSGCRDKGTRAKLDNIDEKACTKRVLEGDIDFVLNAL